MLSNFLLLQIGENHFSKSLQYTHLGRIDSVRIFITWEENAAAPSNTVVFVDSESLKEHSKPVASAGPCSFCVQSSLQITTILYADFRLVLHLPGNALTSMARSAVKGLQEKDIKTWLQYR